MSITKEQLENCKKVIENDINTAKQRIVDIEKKKTEDVALINALQGALQQCDIFLKELDNEKSEMASDDGNDGLALTS